MASDPLMLNIPDQLQTQRLLLCAPRFGDGKIICATVLASLAELKAWMLWATDTYSQDDAEQWCRRGAVRFLSREELSFLLFQGSHHVGNLSLFGINWKVPCCEIGYWLSTADPERAS